jgi:hypothetical protein
MILSESLVCARFSSHDSETLKLLFRATPCNLQTDAKSIHHYKLWGCFKIYLIYWIERNIRSWVAKCFALICDLIHPLPPRCSVFYAHHVVMTPSPIWASHDMALWQENRKRWKFHHKKNINRNWDPNEFDLSEECVGVCSKWARGLRSVVQMPGKM